MRNRVEHLALRMGLTGLSVMDVVEYCGLWIGLAGILILAFWDMFTWGVRGSLYWTLERKGVIALMIFSSLACWGAVLKVIAYKKIIRSLKAGRK